MLAKITRNNKHDTMNNPEIYSLADGYGYITVYLGEYKRTLHNCHTWPLNKDQAIALGRIKALIFKSPDFYCVTGKVKLDDVITHVNVRGRDEIAVLQKNVSSKTKEFFNAEDIELMEGWTIWM